MVWICLAVHAAVVMWLEVEKCFEASTIGEHAKELEGKRAQLVDAVLGQPGDVNSHSAELGFVLILPCPIKPSLVPAWLGTARSLACSCTSFHFVYLCLVCWVSWRASLRPPPVGRWESHGMFLLQITTGMDNPASDHWLSLGDCKLRRQIMLSQVLQALVDVRLATST